MISGLIDKFKKVGEELDTGEIAKKIVRDNDNILIDMNAQDQLYAKGVNRLGVRIDEYQPYRPLTIQVKIEKRQPYDRVTLKDTGEFYDSFYVETAEDLFYIKASDEKTNWLIKKYGAEIFGLTNDSLAEFINDYVKDEAYNRVKEILNER
nr:MAG: virion morphogenesis family protein [Bacteriophage sp.]